MIQIELAANILAESDGGGVRTEVILTARELDGEVDAEADKERKKRQSTAN